MSQEPSGGLARFVVAEREGKDPIEMHRRVAVAVHADADLGSTLEAVARHANELLGTNRCSVFLRDDDRLTGCFRGYAAHALAGRDEVPRMVCGGDADRMTSEIVATGRPVFVRDAIHDGRPVRSTMLRLNVRDILGVPMMIGDDVIGLLFVDQAGHSVAFTEDQQRLAAVYANLCAITVSQVQRVAGLETTVGTLKRNVIALRRNAAIDQRFAELEEIGASPRQIVQLLGALTGLPCGLYTNDYESIATHYPAGLAPKGTFPLAVRAASDPTVALELESLSPGSSGIIGPHLHCDLPFRSIVAPITAGGNAWGHLALIEQGRRFTISDRNAVERAAHTLKVELRGRSRGPAALAGSLGAGLPSAEVDSATLNRELASHGLQDDVPRLVCMFHRRDGEPWTDADPQRLEAIFDRRYGAVQTIAVPDGKLGVVLVVEQNDNDGETFVARTRLAVEETLREYASLALVGVVSSAAPRIEDLARAYTECRQLMRCMVELCPEGTPPLTANDLGVGRLLLGTSDGAAMNRFVRSALGPLLTDDPKDRALLTTLHVFLESSRSPRLAGRMIDVHENTVRYRLAKAFEVTGLNVSADLNDQLTVQVALLILRLQGRLPGVDVFGRLTPATDAECTSMASVGADDSASQLA
jgi:GAF domain-containing protein